MTDTALIRELERIAGEGNVLTSPEDLVCYSYDGTWLEQTPRAVVCATTPEAVAGVLRLAGREGLTIMPRGAGTSLAGGAVPAAGSIVLSLTRMNRILEIDRENMVATVEAGVVTAELQAAVERQRLFYPPDPASAKQCTLGGNIATGAGGPRGLKYGVTRDYLLGLEVVLPSGDIIHAGGKVLKDATGYSLTHLFVGSEGTLGVITKAILRLIPQPAARGTAMAAFSELEQAASSVNRVLLSGVIPAAIEIMDKTTINCVEQHLQSGLPREAEAALLAELDGEPDIVAREVEKVARLFGEAGGWGVRAATTPQENEALWRARTAVSGSLGRMRPNRLGEDISVPRSAVPTLVRRIQDISRRHHLPIATFGHIGDGNLHPNILFDARLPDEVERCHRAARDILAAAVELGGTLSGEHGIGLTKKDFLGLAVEPAALALMRGIKGAFDPHGILNPDKIFPGPGPK